MTPVRPRRSALFTPAGNARALAKARDLPADLVIIDLEDAVGPGEKDAARAAVVGALQAGGFGDKEVIVRINALETPEGPADLDAILPLGPDAVLLPKVNTADDIANLCAALDHLDVRRGLALWAMIETPQAVMNLAAITEVGAKRRLSGILLGANDLAASLRAPAHAARDTLAPVLSNMVIAARAHGLVAIDAVYNAHNDVDGFAAEAREARNYGFDGKALIHPDQIAPCHAAFAPTAEELNWARKVVAAFQVPENLERGAIAVDGRMVERLHLDDARRILELAERAF